MMPKTPKWSLEITKLVEFLKKKRLKILRNVKMRWISMLSPTKHILVEYKFVVMPCLMNKYQTQQQKETKTFHVMWKPFLGLNCIIPLLECMPFLSKFDRA
jgi:hypothetical protein